MLGEWLFVYLAASSSAASAVLVKEDKLNQQPVYFVSQVLQGAKLNNALVEKVAFALVYSSKRLRPYFQPHEIVVYTNQPLKQILHKAEHARRMLKWAVELGQYGIEYKPRKTIKAQALVNFAIEITRKEDNKDKEGMASKSSERWTLLTDRSSTARGTGTRLVLVSPERKQMEHAMILSFKTTNNEAKY
ncbi:hypothetical protein CRG98_029187 [Punica granatum]|uniref:Reverse transcriptase RNase H-like domain-containing protein n=1 Tax=Punica granatum TaxID=22663 RepID=A0A2I0J2H7_PUNGR|nr:hypothetical protein CRG98_029187 [Punica granatum]